MAESSVPPEQARYLIKKLDSSALSVFIDLCPLAREADMNVCLSQRRV